jgi:predicted MFS family arabinose efflux permease
MTRLLQLLPRSVPPFAWLGAAMFSFGMGWSMFTAISTNFMVEELHIRPDQLGLLESIRELPGLLTLLIGALVMTVAEPVVGAAALLLVAIGYLNYFHVRTIEALVAFSLIGSVGFHLWWPVANTIALRLSARETQGRRLGQLRSLGAIAQLSGVAVVAAVVLVIGMRPIFIMSGMAVALGAVFVFRLRGAISGGDHEEVRGRTRIVLRRRYWLYYMLTFLDGGRRHIFMTFAIFLLVRNHGVGVQTIALLGIVNGAMTVAGAYFFGRLIDRVGERPVLVLAFGSLTVIFVGYATTSSLAVLFVLYILDNLFFSAELGITTYLRNILVTPDDLRPSLVAGMTMNHVAAVVVPLTGGILWQAFGHQVPFIGGAILAVISMGFSTLVRYRRGESSVPVM